MDGFELRVDQAGLYYLRDRVVGMHEAFEVGEAYIHDPLVFDCSGT